MKTNLVHYIAVTLLLAASAGASLVNVTSITYTGTAPVESGINLGDASNLTNGTGLSEPLTEANVDTVTHANPSFSAPGNAWTTNSPGGDFFAAPTGTVVFEIVFDGTYHLSDFHNWSYDFDEPYLNGNNIRTVTVDYGAGDFASSAGSIEFPPFPANNLATSAPLAITADRVRITVTDNYFGQAGFGGGDRVSAAEFAFIGIPASSDPILTTPDAVTVTNNGATQTIDVTLTNDGAAQPLQVTDVRVTGTDSAGFTVLTDFTTPLSIAPGGGTAVVQLQVDPANLPAPGIAFADTVLEIDSNDTLSPPTRAVPIEGVVRDPWMESVAAIDLGTVPTSAGIQNFSIDVTNLGVSELEVFDGFFSGAPGFNLVDDLAGSPLVVPAGETRQIQLRFDPTGGSGLLEATLELFSDDPVTGGPSIPCTVNVLRDPGISVPSAVDIELTGLDPQAFSIPIDNVGPTSDLVISSASFTAGDTGRFSVADFDTPIAASASGNINLGFDPSGLYGTYSAVLEIASNDSGGNPAQVRVTVTVAPTDPSPLSPVAVDDAAANSYDNGAYAAVNLINGSFVSTLGDAPAAAQNWVSNSSGGDYFEAGPPPVLVFDMGADTDLRLLYLWAYSEGTTFGGDRQGNSARSFSLRFATAADGTTGFGTTIPLNPSFNAQPAMPTPPAGGASDQPVQIFDFGTTVTARYVEVTLTDNHFGFPENDGGDRVGLNEIAFDGLGNGGGGAAYQTWIAAYPGLTGASALPGADPDGDGIDNEGEFGFDGHPDDAANSGKVFMVIADGDDAADTADELILTVAMRSGAVFPASGSPLASAAIDGIVYQVAGSVDLADFTTQVNLETSAVGTAGLPAPTTGWEYRSFSLEGSNGLPGKGFLRAAVTSGAP